jgi:predicted methyltransferase
MKQPARFPLRPLISALAIALMAAAAQAADAIPAHIRAAVADPARAPADVQRDANRKPAEVLAFAGVKPGDKVAELLPGRGYYTALFCKAVGAQGHVYAVELKLQMPMTPPPDAPPGMKPGAMPPLPPPVQPICANVTVDTVAGAAFKLPADLDMVWTSENYHDLFGKVLGVPDVEAFNKVIFNALKPGGVYMIEDHAAAAGSGNSAANTLHRIEPAFVMQQVLKAGFVFEGEGKVLRNPDDPHIAGVMQMQGKSDKFLFKFRKPRK